MSNFSPQATHSSCYILLRKQALRHRQVQLCEMTRLSQVVKVVDSSDSMIPPRQKSKFMANSREKKICAICGVCVRKKSQRCKKSTCADGVGRRCCEVGEGGQGSYLANSVPENVPSYLLPLISKVPLMVRPPLVTSALNLLRM